MYKTLTTLLLLLSFPLLGQDFDNYQLLRNQGPIPSTFTTPSSKKYEAEILNMDKELKAREQKDQKQFYLETNFVIDDLLKSGKVLFGTEVNEYVNKVGNKVLEAVPELKDKVEFYVLRSSAVNAFATNQGIVFINMGLLAQLENEAQLAFIIAHELTHVQKQHSLNKFLNKKDINRNMSRKRLLQSSNFDEALVATNSYSKELEFEADKGGLDIYLKTDYSLEEIKGVFDVLRYAHLLFEQVPFDKNFFNSESLKVPSTMFLDSTTQASTLEVDPKESTHPSTTERQNVIEERIENIDNQSRKDYLISEETFSRIKKIARFELSYYYLHAFRFEEAIYTAFILLNKTPNNQYLQKVIAKALYGIAKFKNETSGMGENSHSTSVSEDVMGPLAQVFSFTEKISSRASTIIALSYMMKLNKLDSKDEEIKLFQDDLFIELAQHISDLSELKTIEGNETDSLMAQEFDLYAFDKKQLNEEFKVAFEEGQKIYTKNKERKAYYESTKGKEELANRRKRIKKQGAELGISNILIVNPYYLKLDTRKDNAYRFIATEKGQDKFFKLITKNAKIAKLDVQLLDVNHLEETEVERFNDINKIDEWLSQQARTGEWTMPGFEQETIDQLAEKYGSEYILKIGVIMLRNKKTSKDYAYGFATFLGIITAPIGIMHMISPSYEMLYFAVVFDVKNQRFQVLNYSVFNRRDSRAQLNAYIYETMYQIKTPAK